MQTPMLTIYQIYNKLNGKYQLYSKEEGTDKILRHNLNGCL